MIKENRFVSEISDDLTENAQFLEKCIKYNIDVYKCCELI